MGIPAANERFGPYILRVRASEQGANGEVWLAGHAGGPKDAWKFGGRLTRRDMGASRTRWRVHACYRRSPWRDTRLGRPPTWITFGRQSHMVRHASGSRSGTVCAGTT